MRATILQKIQIIINFQPKYVFYKKVIPMISNITLHDREYRSQSWAIFLICDSQQNRSVCI